MTATITPSASLTSFDYAWGAAQLAGWPPEPAFHAVCYMKTTGMGDREIELAFIDAARRLQ